MTDFISWSFALCALVGLVYYSRIPSRPLRYLIIFLAVNTSVDFFLTGAPLAGELRTLLIRSVYVVLKPIEYGLYVAIFGYCQKGKPYRTVAWASVGVLATFGLYELFFDLDNYSAATNVILVEGIFTLVLVLNYFYELLFSDEVIYITREPLFWLATALLFFYAGNVVVTGFYHRLYDYSPSIAKSMYYVNYTGSLVLCVLFGATFVLAARNRKTYGK